VSITRLLTTLPISLLMIYRHTGQLVASIEPAIYGISAIFFHDDNTNHSIWRKILTHIFLQHNKKLSCRRNG